VDTKNATEYLRNRESSMEGKNKHYPEEFKKQIVELYENGKIVTDLAREYGLVEQTIYKWIHRYEPFAKNAEGETVTQADVKTMKQRIAELEMENEILKKATAIFAKTK
jgi:transposase